MNSSDLCCCVWVDLSYNGAFLLSYCGEKITIQQSADCEVNSYNENNIRVRRLLNHSCLCDEILKTSDPDMIVRILQLINMLHIFE